jgi:hypothetical protein
MRLFNKVIDRQHNQKYAQQHIVVKQTIIGSAALLEKELARVS